AKLARRRAFWALNSLPARMRREGYGSWPNWFARKTRGQLRLLARDHLAEMAQRFEGADFASLAADVAEADARRDDRHRWIRDALRVAAAALASHPPATGDQAVREQALLLLDFPLNVRRSRHWRVHVGRFYQRCMARALDEIAHTRVREGLHVWKMYNMGFVVKSARHCVGFDIHPGSRRTGPLSAHQQDRLAGMLDAALVSHLHFDHLHAGFLRRMLAAGKQIVLPPTLRPGLKGRNVHRVYGRRAGLTRIGKLSVRSLPGWQRLLTRNNVYVVDIDGHRVLHNGDNTRHGVYYRVSELGPIDVILANCWSGFGQWDHLSEAQLLITGHENELSHVVSMRAPFRRTYAKVRRMGLLPEGLDAPSAAGPDCRVLSWGEGLRWRSTRA
ncbi:hypothetical protein LCGC14_2222060, partial [marine sediment metagenome]